MKRAILKALGIAFPIEIVNFFVFMPAIDVGLPEGAPWYIQLIGWQWAVLHWPVMKLTSWLDPFDSHHIDWLLWLIGGYIDTFLILSVCILGVRWLRDPARKRLGQAI